MVKKCIDAGVDVNMKIEFVRDKMFMWTDERGFIEYEGVKTGEFAMESPLDLAILAKNPMVVELLTKAGAKNYAQLRKERLLSE